MNAVKRLYFSKRVILFESIGFIVMILFFWIIELVDIPNFIMRGEPTPINWVEALIESSGIAFLGAVCVIYTKLMLLRLKYLEGIIPICSSCKKIRDDSGQWRQIESYIREKSEAEFSHGLCPECMKKLYPDIYAKMHESNKDNNTF